MSDTKIPESVANWIESLNWSEHHDEWHYTRRFDYWPFLAANHPDPAARVEFEAMVAYAESKGWARADFQEGAPNSGLDFLAMHRAMLMLIRQNFPQYASFFEGWSAIPFDPADASDPVPGGEPFEEAKKSAIEKIGTEPSPLATDDEFGRYVETPIRPTPDDPTNRAQNQELGMHNYFHNRWSIEGSEINLGDPKVNIFNTRFWKLHGWIDRQWAEYRTSVGSDDNDPAYKATIDHYLHMMGHHHHVAPRVGHLKVRPDVFSKSFSF